MLPEKQISDAAHAICKRQLTESTIMLYTEVKIWQVDLRGKSPTLGLKNYRF